MKIQTKIGNLFTNVTQGHIVHGCNAQGIMSSGFALGVKQIYPRAYESYKQQFDSAGLVLGYAYPVTINQNLMIWNAITQEGFGGNLRNTSYDAVETCFSQINNHISKGLKGVMNMQPNEIHIPLIGSARGGGKWEIIREIIEQSVIYPVTLWLPDDTVTTR